MLTTSQINQIRDLYAGGMKPVDINRLTGRDPKTIRKYLAMDDFSIPFDVFAREYVDVPLSFSGKNATAYTSSENNTPKSQLSGRNIPKNTSSNGNEPPTHPDSQDVLLPVKKSKPSKLDPFKPIIDKYLADEVSCWYKQHHTSKQIWKRLMVEEGYTGSYSLVRNYVCTKREASKPKRPNLELAWEPGDAQLDFGEAYFRIPKHKDPVLMKYMVLVFPFSNKEFVQVFGDESTESVCQGLKDIFQFIQGVPKKIIMDSSTGAGGRDGSGVYESELFQRFRAHYRFQVVFHENWVPTSKTHVEAKVKNIRKTLFTPPETITDIEMYNDMLLYKNDPDDIFAKEKTQVNTLFFEDFRALRLLPTKDFDVTSYSYQKADSYGRICLDGCHWYLSRPEYCLRDDVMVGVSAHFVDIYSYEGKILVRYMREYGNEKTVSRDNSTTIDLLMKRPQGWWNCLIRFEMSPELVSYFDSRTVGERRGLLNHMRSMLEGHSLDVVLCAMDTALNDGVLDINAAYYLVDFVEGKKKPEESPQSTPSSQTRPKDKSIRFLEQMSPQEIERILDGVV